MLPAFLIFSMCEPALSPRFADKQKAGRLALLFILFKVITYFFAFLPESNLNALRTFST